MKIVVVLDKGLGAGTALNAAAHMALGLAARASAERASQSAAMMFQQYRDGDGGLYPYISGLSLIVLKGKPSAIRTFHARCLEQDLLHTVFLGEMTGDTYKEQLSRLAATPSDAVTYYGVCAIGARDVIDPLTKRFSLWGALRESEQQAPPSLYQ